MRLRPYRGFPGGLAAQVTPAVTVTETLQGSFCHLLAAYEMVRAQRFDQPKKLPKNDNTEDRLFGSIRSRRFFCKSNFWARDRRKPSPGLRYGLSDQESGGHLSGEHFIRSLFCHLSGGGQSAWRTAVRGETGNSDRERAHSRTADPKSKFAASRSGFIVRTPRRRTKTTSTRPNNRPWITV